MAIDQNVASTFRPGIKMSVFIKYIMAGIMFLTLIFILLLFRVVNRIAFLTAGDSPAAGFKTDDIHVVRIIDRKY